MKNESIKDYLDNIPVYLPGRDREYSEHPAWKAWLKHSGHIPGTVLGTSGRDNWTGFRAGFEAAIEDMEEAALSTVHAKNVEILSADKEATQSLQRIEGEMILARAIIETIGTTAAEDSDTLRQANRWIQTNFPTP